MSIADRALAAHEHKQEEDRLRKEAQKVRRRGVAVDAISRALETLGIETTDLDLVIEPDYFATTWKLLVPIDDDCSLEATCRVNRNANTHTTNLRLKPADDLYYDMPPGATARGGTYGFYGLSYANLGVTTLASLGAAIETVRAARKEWRRKHNVDVSQDSEMQKEVK